MPFFVVVFYINGSSCPKGGDSPLALCSIRSPLRHLASLGVLFGRATKGRIACRKASQESAVKGPYSQTEKGVNVMSITQGIRPALYSHSLGWEQGLKAEEDGLGPRSRVSPGNLSCVELSKDQAHPLDLLLRGWCAGVQCSQTV